MKGSFNYVMVTQKDGSRVRVTREAYAEYEAAARARKKKPQLHWTL